MEKMTRPQFWREVLWGKSLGFVALPWALVGVLIFVRDEMLDPNTAEKLHARNLFGRLAWPPSTWLIITLLVLLLMVLEAAYRVYATNEGGTVTSDLAFEALRKRDDELTAENKDLRQQVDGLIKASQPRRLTDEQMKTITEHARSWPAFKDEPHKRRLINVMASPKGYDSGSYAGQILMALESGGIYASDDAVHAFTFDFDEKFAVMHDANVTIFGSDRDEHEGQPLHDLLFEAFKAADIDVTQTVDVNQIGGLVAVVVGRGKTAED